MWQVGSQRQFTFPVKDHVELGLALDLFDFEAAAEVGAYLNPSNRIEIVLHELNCPLNRILIATEIVNSELVY